MARGARHSCRALLFGYGLSAKVFARCAISGHRKRVTPRSNDRHTSRKERLDTLKHGWQPAILSIYTPSRPLRMRAASIARPLTSNATSPALPSRSGLRRQSRSASLPHRSRLLRQEFRSTWQRWRSMNCYPACQNSPKRICTGPVSNRIPPKVYLEVTERATG